VASLGGLERKERLVLAGMGVFATSLAAAGIVPGALARFAPAWGPLPAAALCLCGTGFGAILFYSATQTLIQTAVPDELRGRIMGIWMIVFSGSVPLGALWAGRLAQSRGVAPVMVLSAALCAAVALGVGMSGVLTGGTSPHDTPSGRP
jgi:MFS family permease